MTLDWRSRRWLVLTGAGVSTDSGIPDYRGPDAPPRTPMTYQEFIGSAPARRRYWARAHVGWSHMRAAEPNAAHRDLARRQRDGQLLGLITQNVDGLHQRAGSTGTIDLHGRLDRVVCLDCGETSGRDQLHRRLRDLNPGWTERAVEMAPDGDVVIDDTASFVVAPCLRCDGRLKPDVVFFGETVPKARVQRCFDLIERASSEDAVLLVLGSSLQVMSGLRFVKRAAKDGVGVVIVNRGTTRGDDLADLKLDAGVAETLTALPI
ncbi:NAD-dependent deacetylase [Aeromicrobium sp. PE09-221]|uniref:NAD-dependent protein deacetylase n=1 Tax=Aeromicrobium sp. PE09-221 TaxID=1898043 RepID=UPI000B3EA7F1|nr:NAD-dependent protein deacetylase [Aeromicrobium sp. PE09-221]OUZ12135.1 NAD-dependent deacetylase [Aeromicrobium sp. PE09-221]